MSADVALQEAFLRFGVALARYWANCAEHKTGVLSGHVRETVNAARRLVDVAENHRQAEAHVQRLLYPVIEFPAVQPKPLQPDGTHAPDYDYPEDAA